MIAAIARSLGYAAIRRIADWRGFDLVRRTDLPPDTARFVCAHKVDLVVDVGAHKGEFARSLRAAGYTGRIVSLEPVARLHARLSERVDPNWQVLPLAAGETGGEAPIHVARATDYSSLRQANATGLEFDADMVTVATEMVRVAALDDLPELAEGRRVFLKVDTQGFEEPVLRGAERLLRRAVGVQLELPLVHIYDDVWRFEEAIGFMAQRGFRPAQFHPVSYCHDDPASLLEVDCLFSPGDRKEDCE